MTTRIAWAPVKRFRDTNGVPWCYARGLAGYYVLAPDGQMTSAVARVYSRMTFARYTLTDLRSIYGREVS